MLTGGNRGDYCPIFISRVFGVDSVTVFESRDNIMAPQNTVEAALRELQQALSGLENAIDMRIEVQRESSEVEAEVKRVHADRARLAHELDQSEFRANRLEEVNREVSRRLVTAMETIRAVLDR